MMIVLESIANVVWVAAILYVFTAEVLHVGESWWGYINTFFFTGLIIGGIICSKQAPFIEKHMRKILMLSSAGIAVVTFCFGVNTIPLFALILACLSGLIEQIKGIILTIYLQKESDHDSLPKIYSAQSALSSIVFGLASLIFGVLADVINVQIIFALASFILLISAWYVRVNRTNFAERYQF